MPHKSKTEYQIFWLVNGERIDSYHTMEQRVLAGDIAVEVSVESQKGEAERNELLHKWARIKRERFNRELIARQFENSPEGQRAAALRTAAENPGGIVTGAESNENFVELDAFGRRNNPFKI